jgi:hypothetical protein
MPEALTRILKLGGLKTLRFLRRVAEEAADRVTKKLFLAVYEVSDDAYWQRHASECEWRSLDGIIEYTPELLAVPSDAEFPVYLIAVRAASNRRLDHVVIKIKAKKSGTIYRQEITQAELCAIPVRKALTEIPLKPKSSKGTTWQKLGDIYIKLAEAVDGNGVDLVTGKKIAEIFPSTGTHSAAHRYVERWGQYWNLDEIDIEKENIKTRCYQDLVQSAKQLGRPLTMRRTAHRLMTSRLGLALTFWSQNLWDAEGLRASISKAKVNNRPLPSENVTPAALPSGGRS